jgi:hypothetical protein
VHLFPCSKALTLFVIRYKNGGGGAQAGEGAVRVGDEYQAAIPMVEEQGAAPGGNKKNKLSYSKIQGTAEPRKPRVGVEFQATLPDCSGAP